MTPDIRDLPNYTDRQLLMELARRENDRTAGICSYCGKHFNDPRTCKQHEYGLLPIRTTITLTTVRTNK